VHMCSWTILHAALMDTILHQFEQMKDCTKVMLVQSRQRRQVSGGERKGVEGSGKVRDAGEER